MNRFKAYLKLQEETEFRIRPSLRSDHENYKYKLILFESIFDRFRITIHWNEGQGWTRGTEERVIGIGTWKQWLFSHVEFEEGRYWLWDQVNQQYCSLEPYDPT